VNRAARLARVSTLLALVAGVAACIDADGAPIRTPDVSATSATGTVAPTLDVPSPTPDEATPAVIDSALLQYLPESIEAFPVTEALDEAALALADPALTGIATALDVGLALDESTGNLVIAHVVRLREGAFDDGTYRQWRDSYDDGACAAAGGVNARAEIPIDGRTVFVTSCVGDLRVYHVWIEDQHLLISASSVGAGRFGELLMGELRV
jgi:hypothetical protein